MAAGLELGGIAPDLDEDLADQVFGRRLAIHEPHQEAEHPHIVASEQDPHGIPVALGDQADQHLVGGLLAG